MDLGAEEEARRSIRDSWFRYGKRFNDGDDNCTSSSSIGEDSSTMGSEGSSSETTDDASSSPSPVDCGGALSDLSEIMNHLPMKRGLSKFYNGKSESFTSLSRVLSVEDLAKKASASPYRRSLKASKSYAQGLNFHRGFTHPKPIITKRATPYPSPFSSKRHSFVGCHKNGGLPLSYLPENLEC